MTKPSLKMPQKPSSSTVLTLALIFILFVFGGGMWDIVFRDRLRSMGSTADNQPVLIYHGLDYQYVLEGLVASILIFAGFIGIIIMYQSTRHVYRPSYAKLLLLSGVALLLISYGLLVVMLGEKFVSPLG